MIDRSYNRMLTASALVFSMLMLSAHVTEVLGQHVETGVRATVPLLNQDEPSTSAAASLSMLSNATGRNGSAPVVSTTNPQALHTVSGVVRSAADGTTMPGVNVLVKGTTIGAATDAEGQYAVEAPSPQDTLVFSAIGYVRLEIPIEGRAEIDVELEESVEEMGELVVVGYGTQRKSTVTGSISSIDLEETTPLATQRTDQMLQGRASGVMVRNVDAAPGGETTVRIRGMNSIRGGNNALIVVDGMQGRDLTSINPQDIANIEILKDASATAIYGSQGANGVVLITTKQGQTGAPRINYTSELGTSTLAKRMDLLTAAEYARHVNMFELSNNVGRDPSPIFSESEIQQFESNGGTDWQDMMYRRAMTQNHQLAVSGGTEEMNYYVSGAYLNQEGILRNSGYNRLSLRANVRADVVDWLRAGVNWSGSRENDHSPKYGSQIDFPNNPVQGAIEFPPTLPVYADDGVYAQTTPEYGPQTLWNPVASADEPFIDNSDLQTDIRAFLDFQLLEGLSLQVSGAGSITEGDEKEYWNLRTFAGAQTGGEGYVFDGRETYYQWQNILTYDNSFGGHNVTATAVAEQKRTEYFSKSATNNEFLNHDIGVYDMGGSEIQNTSSSHNDRLLRSGLGRMNYDYNDRYLLSVSYRADGSSVFGSQNKWSYFPAASVGWRISDESFMQDVGAVSNLMLRASGGRTGNQAISPYQTLAAISQFGNYPWSGGEGITRGYQVTRAANPALRWETTTQTNVGVDLGLFSGRINMAAEYYSKLTEDLLLERELPRSTGLSSVISNVGSMRNNGFEFSIDYVGQIGELQWTTGANMTRSTTIVEDLGPGVEEITFSTTASGTGATDPLMWLEEGEEFGQMRGLGYAGTWNTDEREEAAAYGQLPGDPKYIDANDDGQITFDDRMVIGNALPDLIFGLTNRMSYRNFSLDFLIQGTWGADVYNYSRIRRNPLPSTEILDRWTPENQDTDVPAIIDAQTREDAGLTSQIFYSTNLTSRWVEDASYLRLKNIALGYALPASVSNRLQVNSVRFHISATNLITITDYTGFDPEVSSNTYNDAALGTDFNNYPPAKMFNLGVNVSF